MINIVKAYSNLFQGINLNKTIDFFQCWFTGIDIYKTLIMLLEILLGFVIILAATVAFKYYFKPKAEIKRYTALFKSLGYTVYEYPFSFMGIAFADAQKMGVKLHRDAQYLQKTVLPQVDVAISNCVEKVMIFLINPDLMKEFYSGNTPYKYPKLETMISGIKVVIGEGLLFSQGEMWKKKKKLLSKVFNFDLIKENIPKMVEICNHSFDKYDKNHQIKGTNQVKLNLINLSSSIYSSVVIKFFLGHTYSDHMIGGMNYGQFVVDTMQRASELTLTPLIAFLGKFAWKTGLTSQIRQLKGKVALMRATALKILKERTEQVLSSPRKQKCSNIIEALIYEKLENKEQFAYNDTQFIDEFQTFLIAGTDTTSMFFTMLIFALGNNPEVHRRVREEINAVIKSDEDITSENLKKLTYIDWIQNETTRMYGPVNGILFRTAAEDNYIKNVPISQGTMATTQPLGNHYNPKYFKDPFVFRPERWEKECDGLHPFALIGFSAGLRTCIGKQVAYIQSKIALIKLIKRYEKIEVPKEVTMHLKFMYEPEPFDVTLTKISPK